MKNDLHTIFGNIDIYLFDQLLKGRFDNCRNVLDVGCGSGRNLIYFLQNGFNVFAIDHNEESIKNVKALSQKLAPANSVENILVASAEDIPFSNSSFDLVISSAVLHFANNKTQFEAMLNSMWRVLKPNGFLFVRLASSIGIETLIKDIGDGRYLLPDGTERYLVDEQKLFQYSKQLNGRLFEDIKTTNVQNLRCMTTWCLQKM
ncbi:MAG TPA: class I SAM-dependent methyltransferase [Bacteroidia bacterium]|nr:class I SAM-dependent methyltransferase [Bacteroidia bacterium]